MKLIEKVYNSNGFRPRPIIKFDESIGFGSIAFSWGRPEDADRAQEVVLNYVSSSLADVEITSPFELHLHLSKEANVLRIGTLLANDDLFRTTNKVEWQAGVEIVSFIIKKNQISWAQIGAPALQLVDVNNKIYALNVATEYSKSFSSTIQSILPENLLGIERNCKLDCGDSYLNNTSRVVFSTETIQSFNGVLSLENLLNQLIVSAENRSHWVAILDKAEA